METRTIIIIAVVCGIFVAGLTWTILAVLRKRDVGVSRELVVGAVGSILAAVIIGATTTVLSNVILPWLIEHTYRGVDLSGKWYIRVGVDGSASSRLEMTADLKQVADKVTGVLVVVFKDGSGRRPLTYSLNGFRSEQFLALTIEKISRKQVGVGTSLVEVVKVGNGLKGYLCAEDSGANQLRCDPCEWARAEEVDEKGGSVSRLYLPPALRELALTPW